jgi:O-antigen/teichoic acid export membrane protein
MLRNSLILTSGTVASQILGFCFSLILARVYQSAEFGLFTIFLSIVSIVAIICTASYDKAIMFTNSKRQAMSVSAVIITITMVISLSLIFSCFLLYFTLGIKELEKNIYPGFFIILFFGIILSSLYQIFLFYNLKSGRLGLIAGTKVGQSVATGGSQFGLSFIFNSVGLIIGYLVGLVVNAFILLSILRKDGFRRREFNRRRMASTARRFKTYPQYVLPIELIDNASHQIQLLLISAFFSISTLGHFAFGQRVLSAPAAVVGQAIGQAFFHAIRHKETESKAIRSIMFRTWVSLFAIGLVPFAVLMLYGSQIFMLVFGSGWEEAGAMAAYCSPLLFARFVSSPTSSIYLHLKMQRAQMFFVIAGFFYRTGSILLYFAGFDIYNIIIFHSAIEIIFIIIYNVFAVRRLSANGS